MKRGAWIVVLFGAILVAALFYTSFGGRRFRCEVCITYRGAQVCRIASSTTREAAQRTAAENACARLEQTMADRMNCPNTPPDRVTWLSQR